MMIMNKATLPTVEDVVCPECYRLMVSPHVLDQVTERGHLLRSYFAWCFDCGKGYCVIQYYNPKTNHWVIHKYQQYVLIDRVPVLAGDFISCNPLPDAPLVMTGVGGDYYRPVSGEDINQTAAQAKEVLIKCVNLIGEVNDTLKQLVRVAQK